MARELPQGQIVPVARPVESFLQPVQRQVAAPAAPQMMPNPSGIRVLGQGSGGSIAGSNQFAELATALAPFSSGLLKLADAGLERYASNEYQRGINEAMRGQVLVNQQIQRSGAEYAAETRKLERTDPQGAVLMDRVSPYRQAGRVNALSRLAATEAQSVMLDEYRNLKDAVLLPEGHPKLAEIKGRAIQRLSEKYRLDPSTPGFVDYVLPQLGQGGDRVTAQHKEDRDKYLKFTVPRTAASEMLSTYAAALEDGRVEWTEYDRATGRPTQRVATLAEPEAFAEGLRLRFEQTVNDMANEAGLQGEAAAMQQQALMQVAKMAGGNDQLRRIIGLVGVGPPDKDGKREPAAIMFGPELLDIKDAADERTWKQRQRGEEMGLDAFDRQAARIAYEMQDGPEKSAAMNQLIEDFSAGVYERGPGGVLRRLPDGSIDWSSVKTKGMPLNPADLGERAVKTYKTGDDLVARAYSNETAEEWIQDVQTRVGSSWSAREADKELDGILRTAKPEDRDDLRRQYAAIRQRKEAEKDDVPSSLTDPLLGAWMKANLRRMYPSNTTEAALRGANITDMLAFGDANVAASAQRQLSAGRRLVFDRLAGAAAKKGEKLSGAEITAITQKALADYGSTDKEALKSLFPGSSTGEPSVGGAPARPPAAGDEQPKPPPGRQAFTERVYPAGQLDNIPDRGQRLKQSAPVMDLPSAQREATRVMNGDAPSAPVSRAAKDAGMSAGKFLLRQLDAYPSFKLPPDARNQLLRSSRGAEAIGSRVASRGGQRPVDVAANWFLNTITGTRPAAAGTMAMLRIRSGGGRDGSDPFMGDGQWGQGPAVTASHPDTGSGFAIPGMSDAKGRPLVLSRSAANSFAAMVRDSGGAVRASDAASAQRSRAKNSSLPGAATNSLHLEGNAMDIHGSSIAWIKKNGARYGWHVNDYKGSHGGHVEFRGGGSAPQVATRPTTRRGGGMTGIATYYTGSGGSDGVLGGRTANGEVFTGKGMTAAVQWGLFPKYRDKWVIVEDLDTNKKIRVWVNDTGQMGGSKQKPADRVIDLSPTAFTRLFGSTSRGTGRIRFYVDPNQRGKS